VSNIVVGCWTSVQKFTRAVLSPGNRAKPRKFRYVQPVGNFIWKIYHRKRKLAWSMQKTYQRRWMTQTIISSQWRRFILLWRLRTETISNSLPSQNNLLQVATWVQCNDTLCFCGEVQTMTLVNSPPYQVGRGIGTLHCTYRWRCCSCMAWQSMQKMEEQCGRNTHNAGLTPSPCLNIETAGLQLWKKAGQWT